jgi:hypothetical protein
MRILDEKRTGMFSYRLGICNRMRLNVERDDLAAYPRIQRGMLFRAAGFPLGTGGDARPPAGLNLFCFQVDRLHRQVPMGCEDFETLLLFALVGFFVGE